MKFVVRWAFRFSLLGIVLAVAAVLLKDTLAKSWLERRLRLATGMDTAISRLDLGLLTPTLTVEGLRIYNPPEFGPHLFLDLPDLRLEYDPGALALGRIQLRTLRLNLRELTLAENQAGLQNTARLQTQLPGPTNSTNSTNAPPSPNRGLRFTGVDTLALTAGRLRFVSLRDPTRNWERQFTLKSATRHNLRNESELLSAIVQLCLQNAFPTNASPRVSP